MPALITRVHSLMKGVARLIAVQRLLNHPSLMGAGCSGACSAAFPAAHECQFRQLRSGPAAGNLLADHTPGLPCLTNLLASFMSTLQQGSLQHLDLDLMLVCYSTSRASLVRSARSRLQCCRELALAGTCGSGGPRAASLLYPACSAGADSSPSAGAAVHASKLTQCAGLRAAQPAARAC